VHILYDHEVFAKQRYGGISRYFFEVISRVAEFDDADVSVFLGLNDTGYDFRSIKSSFENFYSSRFRNINKVHILFNRYNNKLFEKTLSRSAPDVLHKTYYSRTGLEYRGTKIVTVHDMTHEIYPSFFSRGDTHSAMKKECVEKADGLICVSKTTQRDLVNILNVPEEKTCAIYHGNSLRLKVTEAQIVKEPYVLFVGQRWGYKNFNILLTAFANYEKFNKTFKLVCFGGGSPNKSEILYMEEKNITNKVLFMSGSDAKLANLYKYALALVYPSFYEGFGFPPIEAMHYGCPVLASDASSIPEIVEDAGLFFNPYQIEDLIHKLDLLLTDSELRAAVTRKGFIREKYFSWERCARETFSFYNKINKKLG
jgi:glycosyltransferase involved in cell wall biosynthesis